jgi:hypothetical protein
VAEVAMLISVSAPARAAVAYERHTIVHEIMDNGKYRGPPRPELDEAWDDLLQCTFSHGATLHDFLERLTRLCQDNSIRVQKEDLDKANTTSVPLNDDEGGYLASLDVFHTLHCVNKVRQSYYSDYYHDPNPLADQHEHFDHCIDLLRQTIMCHGDISLHTYEWIDDYRFPWPSTRTEHQCRNWDRLIDWSRENYVPSLMGPILSHPVLGKAVDGWYILSYQDRSNANPVTGTSYRGDEPGIETTPTSMTAG